MKRALSILLVGLGLFCSCEENDVQPDAIAFSYIPETNIAETQLGATVYTYDDLIATTAGVYYGRDAIYDCYKKDGQTYYIMNRRENKPDNANQLVGMEGFLPITLQIHDGYYAMIASIDHATYLYRYDFDEVSQTLESIEISSRYYNVPQTLVYLSEEYFVLQMDATWRSLSKEKGATFSRVVYKKCTMPDLSSATDTIDCRSLQEASEQDIDMPKNIV